jgi:hypothetical protein
MDSNSDCHHCSPWRSELVLINLAGWDMATVVAISRLNGFLANTPLGEFKSSDGRLSVEGNLINFQLEQPSDLGISCSMVIERGSLTVQGDKTYELSQIKLRFDLPLEEFTPENLSGARSIALSFSHSGSGAATGVGGIIVDDPAGHFQGNKVLELYAATLVLNALRDNPDTERIILARLFQGGQGKYRPLSYHFYFDTMADGTAALCMLLSLRSLDPSLYSMRLSRDALPTGKTVVLALSRDTFWKQVLVPTLNTGFGCSMAPSAGNQLWFGKWNGRFKKLDDNSWLANAEIAWGSDCRVNFSLIIETHVIVTVTSEVLLASNFALHFDNRTKRLQAVVSGTPSVRQQSDPLVAIANFFQPDVFKSAATQLGAALPDILISDFTDLGAWFVDWPHLGDVVYSSATLDDGNNPYFVSD